MNSKRRNQLIGFIALLLMAIIVYPYVITDKSNQQVKTIPLLPQSDANYEIAQDLTLDRMDIESTQTQQSNSYIDQSISVEPTNPIDTNTENQHSNQSSFIDAQSKDKIYTIQLVALKNRQKIEELVALLILNNYDVNTMPKNPTADQVIRLLVGPYATYDQAEQALIDLKNLTKLEGFIFTK